MIAALRSFFSFPLLAKELAERAARPRTYWMRVIAAILFYGGFWFTVGSDLRHASTSPESVLGSGREMFEAIAGALLICIYAFVPAMLCGVVTQEKERDSLVLLLLTNLRPWQIVIQKYLGGLIPALTFLFLGMPLVAVAFAYGGVTLLRLTSTLVVLLLAVLQIGAVALWASCRFRTTVGAFLATYFVAGALFGLPALCVAINEEMHLGLISDPWTSLAFFHFPPFLIVEADRLPSTYLGLSGPVAACFHVVATIVIFLFAAIRQLPRRAFATSRNRMRRIFAAIDRWAHRVNRLVGGVSFGSNSSSLPDHLPLVWREKRARALARPEYLVRLLVLCMIPVVLLGTLFLYRSWSGEYEGLSGLAAFVGILAVLTLSTTAANGIVNERVNQTFEILLTTPMSAAHILSQKARALRPLFIVAAVPVLTVFAIEMVMEVEQDGSHASHQAWHSPWLYGICAFLTVAVNLPLVTWLAIWAGLWCKTRIRAISLALATIGIWCVAPVFVLMQSKVSQTQFPERYFFLLSPLWVPAANEFHGLDEIQPRSPWVPVLVNFTFYGGILIIIRQHCLANADRYLRR